MSGESLMENGSQSTIMKRVTSIERENFSLVWSINQFGEFFNRKYEFSSPVFLPNSPGTSKWKLVVFPEIAYPEGMQVVLQLFNVSSDDKCYSVNYTVSLVDSNGKDHMLQSREKLFRNYLDYDQCTVTSNRAIKEKSLLQNNGTLTVCCKIDLLFCENPDDTISDTTLSGKNIGVPDTDDLSKTITDNKPTESENINSSPALNDLSVGKPYKEQTLSKCINSSPASNFVIEKSGETVKIYNDEMNGNRFCASLVKKKNTHFKKEFPKNYKGFTMSGNECEKKTNDLSEKIDNFFNKTRDKGQNDSRRPENLKDLEMLSSDLNFLYTTKYQYDVTIHTKDGRIRAHKAILTARSEYFRKTLMPDEKEIQIPDINNVTLDAILFYMYTGQSAQMTFNQAMDILAVSDRLHLEHVKEIAENSLKSQINISNVTDIFRISKEMELESLKMCALRFVAKNHAAVTNSAKWNQMIGNDPHGAGEILFTIASFQSNTIK